MTEWEALSRRGRGPAGPFEGIPAHMTSSLDWWIGTTIEQMASPMGMPPVRLPGDATEKGSYGTFDDEGNYCPRGEVAPAVEDVLRSLERRLAAHPFGDVSALIEFMRTDEDFALDVLDLLAHDLGDISLAVATTMLQELDHILEQGRSVWRVGAVRHGTGLVRRSDPTVDVRATAEADSDRNASVYLARAWSELRSRHPNFDLALDHANKALEAAAKPVVIPKNPRATLGTIIGALEAKPSKWVSAIGTVGELARRLRNVWEVQHRHGLDDTAPIRDVDPHVAEAAIHDAITLVHWFAADLIRTAS